MKNMLTNTNIASIHQAMDSTKAPVKKGLIVDVGESLGFARSSIHHAINSIFLKASKRGYYTFQFLESRVNCQLQTFQFQHLRL
jgi:hypothetical protein